MKRELTWWLVFFILALVVIGQMTGFEFNVIDIQLHDTYYILPSLHGVLFIFTFLALLRILTNALDRISTKGKLIAILVTVINGLLVLSMIIFISNITINVLQFRKLYHDLDLAKYTAIIIVMIAALCLLTILEIKTIRKIRS